MPCPVTEREYAPEELVASIIRKLVDDAAVYLGESVEAAVQDTWDAREAVARKRLADYYTS